MTPTTFPKTALLATLVATTQAHLFISTPEPIPGTGIKTPLDGSGSDFPCHGVPLPTTGGHSMTAGSKQLLAFDMGGGENTAVHGGGSCQISITYETDPAKQKDPANWRVIYSIEGGCPADAKGNLAEGRAAHCTGDDQSECANRFPFTIPKGVKDGHAIMAWTWFNNVGNREFYMNCINVNFSGGDGSEVSTLPNMFVANLAGINSCITLEGVNVKFPKPGKYVTTKTEGQTFPLAEPTASGCGGSGGTSSPVAPSTPASSTPPTPTSISYAPPKVGSGSCTDGTVSCPIIGDIICVDATHFGICDTDNCAIPQAVAPGTRCQNGKIMRRKVKRGLGERLAEHKRTFGHFGHGVH